MDMKLFSYVMIGAFAVGLIWTVAGSVNVVMGF